jgi:hypothetical protein
LSSKKIPKDLLKKEGTSLRISVWDYDFVGKDDFAGELFYPIQYIDSMEKFSTIDMMVCEIYFLPHYNLISVKNLKPVIISELKQPDNYEKNLFGVIKDTHFYPLI